MGLLIGLLTFPLAPIRGVAWVAERLLDQAYEQEFSEGAIRRQLSAAQRALEEGLMTEEQYDEVEEVLVDRLIAAREARDHRGGVPA